VGQGGSAKRRRLEEGPGGVRKGDDIAVGSAILLGRGGADAPPCVPNAVDEGEMFIPFYEEKGAGVRGLGKGRECWIN